MRSNACIEEMDTGTGMSDLIWTRTIWPLMLILPSQIYSNSFCIETISGHMIANWTQELSPPTFERLHIIELIWLATGKINGSVLIS